MSTQSKTLKGELQTVHVIEELTEVFQNTASVKIRQIRKQVLSSKLFFNDMWNIYQQLRVETKISLRDVASNNRQLLFFIASPAGLAGPNDQQIITELTSLYNPAHQDVVVIGSHGAQLLKQHNITPVRAFEVPDITRDFTVGPIVDLIKAYDSTIAFYDSYISLTTQLASKRQLLLEAQELTEEERALIKIGATEVIASGNYIFEPSLEVAVLTLEQAMLYTTVTQLLLESRLAQLASRFTNMTLSHERAVQQRKKTFLEFLSARRTERDEMTRQIMVAAKGVR